MKTRILVRAEPFEEGWIGAAYGGKQRVIATCEAQSEVGLDAHLRAALEYYLTTRAADYLIEMSHAGSWDIPNCPEGFVKRPVDLWACKVAKQTCPIQAQIFLGEPEKFFDGCLLDETRKQSIFDAARKREYRGFHHITGRYLCSRCEEVRGNESGYSYHYPWELASLEDFSEFDSDRDMIEAIPKLYRSKIRQAAVINALCAPHCIEVAALLCPEVATSLRILEFELWRPGA